MGAVAAVDVADLVVADVAVVAVVGVVAVGVVADVAVVAVVAVVGVVVGVRFGVAFSFLPAEMAALRLKHHHPKCGGHQGESCHAHQDAQDPSEHQVRTDRENDKQDNSDDHKRSDRGVVELAGQRGARFVTHSSPAFSRPRSASCVSGATRPRLSVSPNIHSAAASRTPGYSLPSNDVSARTTASQAWGTSSGSCN